MLMGTKNFFALLNMKCRKIIFRNYQLTYMYHGITWYNIRVRTSTYILSSNEYKIWNLCILFIPHYVEHTRVLEL